MRTILIVEDHFSTANVLKSLLGRHGYQIAHVACGEAALDYLVEQVPNLVILDIGLTGIDGKEVLRRIRSNPLTEKLPVIIFSAFADKQMAPELLRIGANECWLKSQTDAVHIIERVKIYMDSAAA